VETPIKDAIHLLLSDGIQQAGRLLFDNNPLSIVCSLICPQENQCEGHCILGKKGVPVHISAIEQYISDYYLSLYKPTAPAQGQEQGKAAIIGSGPAGITIAFYLAQKGHRVTIYDGNERIGGILRYGIPEFRLPKGILDRLGHALAGLGVKIRPNTTIGASLNLDELFRDGFDAVFMGTGVWRPKKLGIQGESLGHVHFAIEYLRNPDVYNLGGRVLVVGAGNVAMDVARTALRHGSSEVCVACYGEESAVTAQPVEMEYAKIDGVRFIFNKAALAFTEEGALLADTRAVADGTRAVADGVGAVADGTGAVADGTGATADDTRATADGVGAFELVPGSQQLYPADSIIVAIGQGPRAVIVSSTKGIEVGASGLVVADDSGRTTRQGVFASGDVVTGARTVVEAVRRSRQVAGAMDAYIRALRG